MFSIAVTCLRVLLNLQFYEFVSQDNLNINTGVMAEAILGFFIFTCFIQLGFTVCPNGGPTGQNFIVNGDFQGESLGPWNVNDSSGGERRMGRVYNRNWGSSFAAELDSDTNIMYRQVILLSGGDYYIQLKHAARQNRPLQTSKMSIFWNQALIQTVTPINYEVNTFSIVVNGNTGNNTLGIGGNGDSDSFGMSIDNVTVHASVDWNYVEVDSQCRCKDGFYARQIGSQCFHCVNQFLHCVSCEQGFCNRCQEGYDGQFCERCVDSSNFASQNRTCESCETYNCSRCNLNQVGNVQCSTCLPTFYLSQMGTCQTCQLNGCKECDPSKPQKCLKCIDPKAQINKTTFQCECFHPYTMKGSYCLGNYMFSIGLKINTTVVNLHSEQIEDIMVSFAQILRVIYIRRNKQIFLKEISEEENKIHFSVFIATLDRAKSVERKLSRISDGDIVQGYEIVENSYVFDANGSETQQKSHSSSEFIIVLLALGFFTLACGIMMAYLYLSPQNISVIKQNKKELSLKSAQTKSNLIDPSLLKVLSINDKSE